MTRKRYATLKVEETSVQRARALLEELEERGRASLPADLRPYFQNGASLSAIFKLGVDRLCQEWSRSDAPGTE